MKKVTLLVYEIETVDDNGRFELFFTSAPSLPVAVKLFTRLFPDLTLQSVTLKVNKEV